MAEIKPLRAWRYNERLSNQIDDLTSPLFDVVSQKQRQALYQNPYNSIHLSVPKGDHPAEEAAQLLEKWKLEGTILQDALPAIYVYYQYFKLPGTAKEFCRKGFICNIRIYDWDEKVMLRHENTIPHSVNDRIDLLRKTQLNVSPTHGLYTDASHELDNLMDEAIQTPILETEDYQGVRDVLGVIQDADAIQRFIDEISPQQIILADGHHRYEGSLLYMQEKKSSNPHHTGNEGYNFHLMYLTNTASEDLRILPTHRVITTLPDFDEGKIIQALENDFIVKPVTEPDTVYEVIHGKPWTFGILLPNHAFKITLKQESFPSMRWQFPDIIRRLDLTILHYFIIEKILGISGKAQRSSPHIDFDRSFSDCLTRVVTGAAQLAIITQEVSIETIQQVCRSGYTLPQKSTYFYPKVICGFLFGSIQENEFQSPSYSRF